MAKYNPFRPGGIVSPGMFSGRAEELIGLESALFQTMQGNPNHFMISGERGIGKSSLLFYLQCIAKGQIKPLTCDPFNFLVVSVELKPKISYSEIVMKISNELKRECDNQRKIKKVAKAAWDFIKNLEVMGTKYRERDCIPQPHELVEDFCSVVEDIINNTSIGVDGILVLIDEADKPSANANLGELLKITSERLIKNGCNKLAFGLAGLKDVVKKLRQSHESSPRMFEIFSLDPLTHSERIEVVQKGLREAENKNEFKTEISEEAENMISSFSEGYPHFIQQYAFCAFAEDKDNLISTEDILGGAYKANGAIHQLGQKYFHRQFFDEIGSDEYRNVLMAMSKHLDDWTSKEQLRKIAGIKEHTLTNAIAALKKKKIIITKDGVKGVYRLPSKSFAVWIRVYIQRQSRLSN